MQLVEKQLLDLDDASVVEQLCPELKNVKVLQADGTLVAKKTRITLRMLLTHTDRAGILVERASGLTLNDYMARHIFEPLQVKNITMVPLADMAARVTGLWQRNKNGELAPGEYLLQAPLSTSGNGDFFHSGGAGLFGSVREFSKAFTAKHAVGLVLHLQKHTLLSCLGSIV
ncbi:hypothetical protein SEUCBS140593_004525 [Sporothrix eucalyptigena]|uniref:Beta-lactamase-related domain-containing protein n=1 Tax=Sporothrix eucalyptigena TaxID=1812306 RepID=A0ABP0BNR9_9PEZI